MSAYVGLMFFRPPSHGATQSVASPKLCMTLVFGQTLVHLLPEPANEILHGDSTTGNVIFYHVLIILMHFSSLPVSSSRFLDASLHSQRVQSCEHSVSPVSNM